MKPRQRRAYIIKRKGRAGSTLKKLHADGRVEMTSFKTRAAALDARADFLATTLPAVGRDVAPGGLTLAQHAADWLERLQLRTGLDAEDVSSGTVSAYKWAFSHILPTLGPVPLAELSVAQILALLTSLLRKPPGGPGLSRKSVFNIKQALSSCLAEQAELGGIQLNPAAARFKSLRLKASAAEMGAHCKALTLEQVFAFLAAAEKYDAASRRNPDKRFRFVPWALYFELAVKTALRPGEELGLQWNDLDAKTCSLAVARTWSNFEVRNTTKGKTALVVGVPKTLVAALERERLRLKALALRNGTPLSPWIFPSGAGTPMDHKYPEQACKAILRAAGLPDHFTPHSLRHTYVSNALRAGERLEKVSRQARHATPAFTATYYGRHLPHDGAAMAERMSQLMEHRRG